MVASGMKPTLEKVLEIFCWTTSLVLVTKNHSWIAVTAVGAVTIVATAKMQELNAVRSKRIAMPK
jgi:hypothetical protein